MVKKNRLLSKYFKDDGIADSRHLRMVREKLLSRTLGRLERKQCPLCSARHFMAVAQKDRQGLPLETLICEACGLVFSGSYFSQKSAAEYYGKYCNVSKNGGRSAEEMFKSRTHPEAYCWLRHKWIKEKLGKDLSKINTVVEIGCNDGCNLLPFHEDGKTVVGCDFDENRMGPGRKLGMTLLVGDIKSILETGVKADLIILSHVMEHLTDIDLFLQQLKQVLAPGGVVYIEVPGLKYWNRPLKDTITDNWIKSGNDLLGYLQLEHNYCFEWATLELFLRRNGYLPVAHDEFVRSLSKLDNRAKIDIILPRSQGEEVFKYLAAVENDRLRNTPIYKLIGRKVKKWIKRFR
ncbi:MAG: class I SAM-dependent methyltransferase [Candidatus Margulisiibacteriota bacterium]